MPGFVFSLNEHAAAAMNQADYQTGTDRLFRPPPENKPNFPGRGFVSRRSRWLLQSCADRLSEGFRRFFLLLFFFFLVQLIAMGGPADGRRPDPDPGRIDGAAAAWINAAERGRMEQNQKRGQPSRYAQATTVIAGLVTKR